MAKYTLWDGKIYPTRTINRAKAEAPISVTHTYGTPKAARKAAAKILYNDDVQNLGWAKADGEHIIIMKGNTPYAWVRVWSNQNPKKGHGYSYELVEQSGNRRVVHDMDSNGNLA